MPILLSPIATVPPTTQILTTCQVWSHRNRYVGTHFVVEGVLTNASPHGIFLGGAKEKCVLDVGDSADGKEILEVFWNAPNKQPRGFAPSEVSVRIDAKLRRKNAISSWGQKYVSYFLDDMKISYAGQRK